MAERDPKTGRFPRGNGPGKGNWGGPAKGASTSRLGPAGDDYSDAIRALSHDPRHAEAKAPLRELALRTWIEVAQSSENDSARVTAAEKIMDRLDGRATAPVTVSPGEGGPLIVERVLVRPADRDPDSV